MRHEYWRPSGQWIAAVLTGQIGLPPPERMWQAIEHAEPRTRSGSRTKAHAASAATRTPTDGYYTPTCGEHRGKH
jgi:hypothetical protein